MTHPTSIRRNDPCPCGSGRKYKQCCLKTQAAAPNAPDPAELLALARRHHDARELVRAVELYRQVVGRAPGRGEPSFFMSQALASMGDRIGAIDAGRAAVRRNPKQARFHGSLAEHLLADARAEEALESCRRALDLAPDDPMILRTLARIHDARHELEDAAAAARRALDLDPDGVDSILLMAGVHRRRKEDREAKDLLEAVTRRDLDQERRFVAYKELGLVLDRLGEYDRAFDAMTRGGAARMQTEDYRRYDQDEVFRRMDAWRRSGIVRPSGTPSVPSPARPVFLIGFPRSGTTLLGKILAAHPDVTELEERDLLPAARRLVLSGSRAGTLPEAVASASPELIDEARYEYWRVARQEAGSLRPVLVDRFPLNLIDAGLIQALFPEARILFIVRDPRDVCVSCFAQRFTEIGATMNFLSWPRTARFCSEALLLWRDLAPKLELPICEIRYEDLVQDLETQARRILEFLELPWNPAVLAHHEAATAKTSRTPSYEAVVEKVHGRAVGRWRHFQAEIEQVEAILDPAVTACGYA